MAAESAVNGTIGVGPKLDGNAAALASYAAGDAVGQEEIDAAKDMGPWNPYDPVHGGSSLYTPEQLGAAPQSCDNCHTYGAGKDTVADGMTWKADE